MCRDIGSSVVSADAGINMRDFSKHVPPGRWMIKLCLT